MQRTCEPVCSNWNSLPNEMRAMIVERMDVGSRSVLKRLDRNSAELVKLYGKSRGDVHILVKHKRNGNMYIELKNDDDDIIFTWTINLISNTKNCKVVQRSRDKMKMFSKDVVGKSVPAVAFRLVESLFADPLFRVRQLELKLGDLERIVNLNLRSYRLQHLILIDRMRATTLNSIFSNFNFYVEKTSYEGMNEIVYSAIVQWRHRSITDELSKFANGVISAYQFTFPDSTPVQSFRNATVGVYTLISNRTPLSRLLQNEEALFMVTQSKVINDIMFLQAAFAEVPVPYLREENSQLFDSTIEELRRGLCDSLEPDVLSLVIALYLCRFIPEKWFYFAETAEKIHRRYISCLHFVVDRSRNLPTQITASKLLEKIDWLHKRDNI